ncbi:MAG: CsbD family protein [Verrucomicrobiota bacterium]|nr:CsbD family protein [Verrucomicrobiota bacterium]
MNSLEIKGDWKIMAAKLKQKWATLTDDDLQYAEGKHEELMGRIQKRTGENREAVEKALKEYSSACGCDCKK